MKKTADKTSQHRKPIRKLVLRSEAIVQLTSVQLSNIVGGDGTGVVCTTVQSKVTGC